MAERHEALFPMEAVDVLTLEYGIVEHLRGADEVDTILPHVVLPARLFPLEHERPLRTRPDASGYRKLP